MDSKTYGKINFGNTKGARMARGEKLTNFENIKSMSVDEMAEFFDSIVKDRCTTICSHIDKCLRNNATEPICKNQYKQWLLQEVSDEN